LHSNHIIKRTGKRRWFSVKFHWYSLLTSPPLISTVGRKTMKLKLYILTLMLIVATFGCSTDGRESFTDKHEWSILQSVEFQSRGNLITAPQFQTIEGYELMVLPSSVEGKHIWIMLRPKSSPFYKQIPNLNYSISTDLLEELVRSKRISATVEEVLRSRVNSK